MLENEIVHYFKKSLFSCSCGHRKYKICRIIIPIKILNIISKIPINKLKITCKNCNKCIYIQAKIIFEEIK